MSRGTKLAGGIQASATAQTPSDELICAPGDEVWCKQQQHTFFTAKRVLFVLVVLGMATCLAGTLLSRNDQFVSPESIFLFRYGSRLCKVLTYFVVALLCWRRSVQVGPLLGAAVFSGVLSFVVGYAAVPALAGFDTVEVAAGAVAGALNGISGALVSLLFLMLLSSYSFRWAAVGIFVSMAASHVLFLTSTSFSAEMLYWAKPLFLLVALVLLIWCCVLARYHGVFGDTFTLGGVRTGKDAASAASPSTSPAYAHSKGSIPEINVWNLVLALIGLAVFPFLYVLIAELNTGWSVNGGMFSLVPEVVGIVVLLLAAVVLSALRAYVSIEGAFVAVQVLFAAGALLLPLVREDGLFLSGMLLKCGFLLYNGLVWSYLAVRPWSTPTSAIGWFGLVTGALELFSLVGRFVGESLRVSSHVDMNSTANAAIIALWVLAMASMVFIFITRVKSKREAAAVADAATQQPDAVDEALQTFARAFGLTAREEEVLSLYARGRTVDYIADSLGISSGTVKTHLKRAYVKADIHSRQELLDALENETKGRG